MRVVSNFPIPEVVTNCASLIDDDGSHCCKHFLRSLRADATAFAFDTLGQTFFNSASF